MINLFLFFVVFNIQSNEFNNAEKYLAKREYTQAIAEYENILKQDSKSFAATKGIAWVYHQKRDFDSAVVWWKNALALNPKNDTAIVKCWEAMYKAAEKKPGELAEVKTKIFQKAKAFLENPKEKDWSIAYDGLVLVDTIEAKKVGEELAHRFPESAKGYEIIGNTFYDSLYPIWTNDTLKVGVLERFLAKYPRTEWRFTAYQYLLSSLFYLNDFKRLKLKTQLFLQEDSLNPFAYQYGAAIFLRAGIDTNNAAKYAKKAIELEPKYQKPKNKPIEQWELEYPPLFGNARMNYAQALILLNDLSEAKKWINEAIEKTKLDDNNDATFGPYYYVLGQIDEKENNDQAAMAAYIKALAYGDVRNYWSAKADSSLSRIYYEELKPQRALRTQKSGIISEFSVFSGYLLQYARKQLNYQGITFTDVTDSIGLGYRQESRVAWGDYDNNGYDDLLLNGNRLFKNIQGKRLVDVSTQAGIEKTRSSGGVWADYNNDGYLDFYAISGDSQGDKLWKNNGNGTFTDVTKEAGNVTDNYPTEGAGWGDYNNDGYVDLYLANYENWEAQTFLPDILYKNNGNGTFKDATKEAGIIPPFGEDRAGRGVNWADYDNDGWLDIYVSNYRLQENFLWHNNGNGSFTNYASLLGVAGNDVNGWYGHTIGSDWGDYNNDGYLDLITANLAHPRYIEFSNRTMLYKNTGPKENWEFSDVRLQTGIKYEETHSDPAWADVDNDGDLDLYITSIYEGRRSFLYENLGNSKFRDITWLAGVRVFNGWGCAFSDFDNDGDLDLVVGSGSGVKLFRNDGANNNYLKVKVIGTKSNNAGIGARIKLTQGKKSQIREIQGGKGTTSQNSLIAHFGLGKDKGLVTIGVNFPSGIHRTMEKIKPNQLVTIQEEE
jgi:tetratricopeptide (TPR) repeat protein